MSKVREIKSSLNETKLLFECPGCGYAHVVDSRWNFNDDFDKPTFSPSVLVNKDDSTRRCHSFVTDGKIRFLDDCYHELAGKTVDLPDLDLDEWE
ncbi:DUF6527 family protein [Orenia marismortui]|uniref:Ammonia monooxygenase n=1 Tax=Orenia marismortui TaxID=46469 RepID=A0A4R8H9F6_9FIRM|nr:DUF6527 family protein [Orenia marismortui]TDX52144.1 hypothetical protein C7959_10866 [Orenia marismortui]